MRIIIILLLNVANLLDAAKDESNRLYGGNKDVLVDEDVREEYETTLLS